MNKGYLVQYMDDDGWLHCKLCNSAEVIELDNMSDIYGVNDMKVWDVTEFGILKELHSKGWQPMCHITWLDDNGNVVIDGYGEDH